jgi:hypothetical protein
MPALHRVRHRAEDLDRKNPEIQAAGDGEGRVTDMPDFEEDHVSSTLRWKDVVLPASVTESDVDKLIFAALRENWRKVAMIVGNVFQTCETRSIPLSDEVIAARIQELAEAERIESQGNLTKWRYSEVRLRQG